MVSLLYQYTHTERISIFDFSAVYGGCSTMVLFVDLLLTFLETKDGLLPY